MLRFILVEEFAGLAQRVDRARTMRDRANSLADRMVALNGAPEQGVLEAEIAACENDCFASQLLYRLRDAPERSHAAIDWLDKALIRRGSDAEEVLIAEETRQSAETVLIASIIRSLRAIDNLDWMKWFSPVSQVDAALAERSNFAPLDFKSRDQYRNAVEELAEQSGHSELEVVEAALRLFEAEAGAKAARRPQCHDWSTPISGSGWSARAVPAVMRGQHLGNETETHGDPCAAIASELVLEPGQRGRLSFLVGDGADAEEAQDLVRRHLAAEQDSQADPCDAAAAEWVPLLDTLQIETPDPAMDLMVDAWLPYQGIACRLRARSAFYQASGAFGFRDQLQDTMAFLWQDAGLARQQILSAAGRQFVEGDFQHWWLPQNGAGVRTTISDDCVWLAYGLCHYVDVTDDVSLLDEGVSFLAGPPIHEGAHDAYFQPDTAQESASVYDQAALGLDLAIRRIGAHGLPLVLGGDWNDGMNRVGEAGRGESVWLGWFLAHALDRLGAIASKWGDSARAEA